MNSVTEMCNRFIQNDPSLRNAFRSPRYRYYCRGDSRDRYFWTTEKVNHKGKSRYAAGIYRFLKTRKAFKLVKRAGFAKRYKAEAAAKAYRDAEAAKH
jgi:hypothetical protein